MVGDVVGKPGRQALQQQLSRIVRDYDVDFVIANGENAAGGNGITRSVADDFFSCGVDVITMGNHVWDKKELISFIDLEPRILRPANYPPGTPGKGYSIYDLPGGEKLGVVNLLGRVFMGDLDCPFRTIQGIIHNIAQTTVNIVIDFHAEATSEKNAIGYFLDGEVSAVCGTHTHVQTADARILPRGTAYVSDIGMTGPYNSVLGIEPELIIERFINQMPVKFQLAQGPLQFNGVVIEINSINGLANSIESIAFPFDV